MAGMMDMMKQVKQMKQMQKQLQKQTCEYENNGIKVVIRGDMTLVSISIDPSLLESGRTERLERLVLQAINNGMKNAQKKAATEMAKDSGGLGQMLGMK